MQLVCFLAFAVLASGEARAQGFFESLFGGGQRQPAEVPQRPMSLPPPAFRTPLSNPKHDRGEDRSEQSPKPASGRYRTLCVRMCDGYYFPISFATTRNGFYKDAKICKASCGEDAKLFYQDKNDTDVRDMTDVSGKPYVRLETAFLYRKRMIEGCKCRPEPWAQSELDRHRSYAAAENSDADKSAVKKQAALGPSDPAVRAVFERQNNGQQPIPEAAGDIANSAAGEPGHEPPQSDGAEPAETSPTTTTGEGDKPASSTVGAKSSSKPKRASSKPTERHPTQASPAGSSSGKPVSPSHRVQQVAPAPAFSLGAGSGQRWPGE